jgi:cytochrome bd-type quinol oxidase subunit 2
VRRPNPLYAGFAQIVAFIPLLAALLARLFSGVPAPSAESMRSVAGIGVALLLGYVIELVWMVGRLERTGRDREDWLGGTVGLAVCGLVAIAASLLVAAHRDAGHSNYLDAFGLWYIVIALGMLGIFVCLQPLIVERWTHRSDD